MCLSQVDSWGPIFAACPEDPEDADALFSALDEANQEVDGNERGMDLYLRDGAPASLLYNSELSDRICPVLGACYKPESLCPSQGLNISSIKVASA